MPPLPPARRGAHSARPQTRKVYVASPSVPGARESVEKVIDTLEHMWRSKQIGDRSYTAGETFRKAWDTIYSSLGNAMDLDRVRGAGAPGKPPSAPFLEAADTIDQAKAMLYPTDFRVACLILGEGRSVKETAAIIEESPRDCGKRLREALIVMASRWVAIGERRDDKRVQVQSFRTFDPRARVGTTGEIRPMKVAHAGPRGVKMTG